MLQSTAETTNDIPVVPSRVSMSRLLRSKGEMACPLTSTTFWCLRLVVHCRIDQHGPSGLQLTNSHPGADAASVPGQVDELQVDPPYTYTMAERTGTG